MNSILDYIDWRGDLNFCSSPFCAVDALIFSQLSYLDFRGIVPADSQKIALSEAAQKFKDSENFDSRKNVGLVINQKSLDLLFACAKSARFANVFLSFFEDKFDSETEEQFSALTFSIENKAFVAFRGTDDTIIGWKEDFNLAFCDSVPAQRDSAEYLSKVAKEFDFLKIGGHSKGGNLAVFAAACADKTDFEKISEIFNFDGPGFSKEKLSSIEFSKVESKLKTFFPKFSAVGMIFEHFPNFCVVESSGSLFMQHDPFTWSVLGASFVFEDALDSKSEAFSKIFNGWLSKISGEKRELFVDCIFDVIFAAKEQSLSALNADSLKSSAAMIKAFSRLDDETRSAALETAGLFVKEIAVSLRK